MPNPEMRREETLFIPKFLGLVNVAPSYRLEPGEMVSAVNVDLDNRGIVSRRSGFTKQFTLNVENLWSDGATALFTSGETLYRLENDYSYTAIASGLGSGRMSYVSVNHRAYFTNTVMQGVYGNGAARSWGMPVPKIPVASEVPGMLAAGVYQYVVTYTRNDGQESGAGVAGRIEVAEGGGIAFTSIPVSTDPGVAKVNVYVSPQNGDVLYFVGAVDTGTTTFSYFGGPSNMSFPLTTQHLKRPPIGQDIAYYRGRMYIAAGNVLFCTLPYNFELADPRDFIEFDRKITLLAPVLGGVFVATESGATVFLRGNDYTAFMNEPVASSGAIPGSLVYAPAEAVGEGKSTGPVAVWESSRGRCMGFGDGTVSHVTADKYEYDTAPVAAGVFMQADGISQHISVLRG